ncbi:MAG: hypothetical protein JNL01_00355 [Bdellovibrionales bacterium]|nr:hypothetical protein [Bdellovibrionales bacterium]
MNLTAHAQVKPDLGKGASQAFCEPGGGPIDPIQYGRADLIRALANEFDVHLDPDDPVLFNEDLLLYLYSYFGTVLPEGAPFYLKSMGKDSMIRTLAQPHPGKGTDISFSTTASRDLENGKLREAREALAKNSEAAKADRIKITIDYSNSLFDALNRELLNRDRLLKILKNNFGIDARAPASLEDSTEFSATELNLILKQLQDLPPAIVKNMKSRLTSMVRMKPGISIQGLPDAAACYVPESNRIIATDQAFGPEGSLMGEDNLLHEMGHALWYSLPPEMQKSYTDLSWSADRKQRTTGDFLTQYSKNNPSEDFADHFAAYVGDDPLLKSKVSRKWKWIHENLFPNVEYFNAAHKNAKVMVESPCPDTKPPEFIQPSGQAKDLADWWFGSNVSYSCRPLDENYVELQVEVRNLKDDLSGLKNIYLSFSRADGMGCFANLGKENCVDPASGTYRLQKVLKRSEIAKGRHKVSAFMVRDETGNTKDFPTGRFETIDLAGMQKPGPTPIRPKFLDQPGLDQKTRVVRDPVQQNLYWVHFPVSKPTLQEVTSEIEMYFFEPTTGASPLTQVMKESWQFDENGELKVPFDLTDLPSGKYYLSGLGLRLEKEPNHAVIEIHDYWKKAPPSPGAWMIRHEGPPTFKLKTDVNQMKITVQTLPTGEKNTSGGNTNLRVQIPVQNPQEEASRLIVTVVVRMPDGQVTVGSRESLAAGSENSFEVPLPPYHQAGEYIVQEIQYQHFRKDAKVMYRGKDTGVIKLLDRGIRKSISVEKPKIQPLR